MDDLGVITPIFGNTHIEPEHDFFIFFLLIGISLSGGPFSGSMLNFRGVGFA